MCSLVAHDRLQLDYKDDESSIGDREIPNDETIKALEALGATFNFIDIWIKLLRGNFDARCEAYINVMKLMFIKITQTVEIALTSKQKNPKTHDRYRWWIVNGKSAKGLPPLRRTKLSKKHKKVRIKLKNIYEANEWWNDWRFQLHWNKLEWVDPKYNPKRVK